MGDIEAGDNTEEAVITEAAVSTGTTVGDEGEAEVTVEAEVEDEEMAVAEVTAGDEETAVAEVTAAAEGVAGDAEAEFSAGTATKKGT